jgi:dTDP-4-dehydrorhamnose 3,5-epimerase
MIEGVIIKKINRYDDQRGWLSEIYRSDEFDFKRAMAYVSLTKPDVIRGPHEHRYQSDCFVFIGPGNFILHLWDRREQSSTFGEYINLKVGEELPSLIIVPPGVVHGYKSIGPVDSYCLNFPDKLYKGPGKTEEIDEIRWEEDKNSPYHIE